MQQTGALPSLKSASTLSYSDEYTIYTYDSFEEEKPGHNRWHRVATIHDQSQALEQAQDLFNSHLYQKVEIKQKSFNEKKGCRVSKTLRIYEAGQKSNTKIVVLSFLASGILAGVCCLHFF